MEKAVEFIKINKRFPGAHVLKDISFYCRRRRSACSFGGKQQKRCPLLNILHGVYTEYEGIVKLHGKEVQFKNVNDAIVSGKISKVHQETLVVKDLTVGQNVTLGYEPKKGSFVDFSKMDEEVNAILNKLHCKFKSEDLVSTLTSGEMQMLAIARALYHHSNIISLDEPTASLTLKETEALFEVIRELKREGVTVLYVSHLEEIFQICDRATVLRDGEFIETLNVKDTTREGLIRSMVGRSVAAVTSRLKPSPKTKEVVLKVENLSNGNNFRKVSFELHKGEILGFFGLVGAGRTEVGWRTIFGADRKTGGDIYLKGKKITGSWNTTKALKAGIGLVPEDRKTQGFLNLLTNIDNVSISSLEKYMTGPVCG